MSKHRTKAQKQKAAEQHRLQAPASEAAIVEMVEPREEARQNSSALSFQWSSTSQTRETKKESKTTKPAAEQSLFLGFNPKWIYQDLRRTAIVSSLIVGILVITYFLSSGSF